jgi:hypothetical protein
MKEDGTGVFGKTVDYKSYWFTKVCPPLPWPG